MPDARQMYRPASFRGRRCHCSGLICINEAYCVVHAVAVVAVVAVVVAAAVDYFECLDASTRNNKLRMLFGYLPFFRRFSRFVSRHF